MKKYFLPFGLAVLAPLPAAHATPAANAAPFAFTPARTVLTSPAGPGAFGASLTRGPDGTVYLSWVEPAGSGVQALKFATFDARNRQWSPARIIVQGLNWRVGNADFPVLAAQAGGRLTAVWLVLNQAPVKMEKPGPGAAHHHVDPPCHALFTQSVDGGITWSPPEPLSRESDTVDFVALQPLADGRLLAAWLDGRGKKSDDTNPTQLWSRFIGLPGGGAAPAGPRQTDMLVDPSVCDCCQLAFTAFPDSSVLLAYRGRTAGEIRDILRVRFADDRWEERRTSSSDGWKIAGCPVNGPALASDGPRVANAWFTAADNEPRVLLSNSPDAGGIFTLAQRVDLGHANGHVAALVLRDGAQLVSWLENPGEDSSQPGGLYLRRYTSFGATMPPALLVAPGAARISGFPRLALVKDFGDQGPAQLIVVYTRSGEPTRLETLLVTLPDAAALAEADRSCDCAPHGEELVGYALRGHLVALVAEKGALRVSHGAIPGVMRAGEREFQVAPAVLAAVKPGAELLARVEQRDGAWWIFDVRLLVPPKP